MDASHLPSYLNEFVFRFNRRRSRSRGMLFYRVLELAVAHDPVRYQDLARTKSPKAKRPKPPGKRGHPPSLQRPRQKPTDSVEKLRLNERMSKFSITTAVTIRFCTNLHARSDRKRLSRSIFHASDEFKFSKRVFQQNRPIAAGHVRPLSGRLVTQS